MGNLKEKFRIFNVDRNKDDNNIIFNVDIVARRKTRARRIKLHDLY